MAEKYVIQNDTKNVLTNKHTHTQPYVHCKKNRGGKNYVYFFHTKYNGITD